MVQHTKPLHRPVNTKARGVHHRFGGKASWDRNTKSAARDESMLGSMHGSKRRGLDYTPLFRFLLSRVGQDWDKIHSEAIARLDRPDPIFWMVAIRPEDRKPYFVTGESTYFSGLYVDGENRLAVVAPDITAASLEPVCGCCTHTFNGTRFTQAFTTPEG